ncbi:cytochrome C [Geomesophilobacter sediminis]|uniref:Cytochrome C n=1 Tax=Geomesophilobacter sediminis TaxID=2798584 RepID=A0A8J7LXR6_9BACT|nr:cytochrome C [Geomesophilobacter sediminis]MBJ6723571.1 cytochrome C [Geomesophilobacter sediminis]
MKRNMFSKFAGSLLALALVFAASSAFAKVATVDIPVDSQMYAQAPQPLTPSQCAQCHSYQFGALKEKGGKHRFACQECHKAFHAYNPNKGNYAEIMPKCSQCHTDIHGPANKDCATCHTNPHTPRVVKVTERLTNSCATCHQEEKAELVQFPSKHSLLACSKCHHTRHGYKPSCQECHKPHYKGQEYSSCLGCHSVHKPKKVTYKSNEPAQTCGSCHTKVYGKWTKTVSKHSKVNCATCHHDKHGYIPKCEECHKAPHPAGILKHYPRCLDCHLDVHELPGMGGKK